MAQGNPLLDDVARVMTGMVETAQSVGEEAKTAVKAQGDKFVADMDLARRDEVEALKALAQSALSKVDALEARIEALEAKLTEATK